MGSKTIGHEGSQSLQDLVVLDDMLDEVEWIDSTPESIHAELEEIATKYLAYPDPWAANNRRDDFA